MANSHRRKIGTLENLNSWSVVKRPGDKSDLHSKFLLKRKRNGDGSISKYKARLFVCGNEHPEAHFFNFTPVIDFALVKLFLAVAIQRNCIVCQFDFENAFVNGKLDLGVFVGFLSMSIRMSNGCTQL